MKADRAGTGVSHHVAYEAESKRPRLNVPQTWAEKVEELLDGAGAQDVLEIRDELQRLTELAADRMDDLRSIFSDSVVLIDANNHSDVDHRSNSCRRSLDAKFLIGPEEASFSVSIEHEDCEGDQRTNIDSSPPLIVVEGCEPNPPDDYEIEDFLKEAGLQHAIPESCTDKSDQAIAEMDADEVRRWVMADIVKIMVEKIAEKKGHEDDFWLGLGIEEGDMFKWLKLNNEV